MLITDHKPLVTILHSRNGIPHIAAARIQRWAIILSGYRYELKFRRTDDHCNADRLSKLPHRDEAPRERSACSVCLKSICCQSSPRILPNTAKDDTLSKVLKFVKNGWPMSVDKNSALHSYF